MVDLALAGAVGGALILAAARYPAVALGVILTYTPFQVPLLAWAFKHGAPAVAVRQSGYIKDAMVLGIGLAAVLHQHRRGRPKVKFRLVDYAGIGYIAIATLYLLLPIAFPGSFGGQSWTIRLNAWRLDTLWVFLLLFCRRAPFSRKAMVRVAAVALLAGMAEAGSAVWEMVSQQSYSSFFVHTIALTNYEQAILHIQPGLAPFGYVIHNGVDNRSFVRAGGFFTDQIELGFFSVLPFALGTQWLVGSKFRISRLIPPVAAAATALLALTRSAILACAVALALTVLLGFTRRAKSRLPALAIVLVGTFAVIPLAGQSTVAARFTSIFSSSSSADDNQSHIQRTWAGFNDVVAHPAGRGLGANPGSGVRFHTTNALISENSYLQVGTELGVAGMVLFILMYLALLRELWRRARDPGPGGELPAAMFAAAGGLLVGSFFIHVWTSFPVALAFWGLSGVVAPARVEPAPDAVPVPPQSDASVERPRELRWAGLPSG